jgi:hypothetical protein
MIEPSPSRAQVRRVSPTMFPRHPTNPSLRSHYSIGLEMECSGSTSSSWFAWCYSNLERGAGTCEEKAGGEIGKVWPEKVGIEFMIEHGGIQHPNLCPATC